MIEADNHFTESMITC